MSIYAHLSYREWLEVWFVERKQQNANYSHRMIARLCKQKSPSFFRDITTGRRNLTPEQEEHLIPLLRLDAEEEQYFRDLVIVDQSENLEIRKEAFERLSANRRIHLSTCLEGEQYNYLSKWYYPAIREMALCPDFQLDAAWISERLHPTIEVALVQEALDALQRLGFLQAHEDGRVEVPEISITTPTQVTGLAVHQYHQQMLQLARESIERHREDERHMLGVTVSIPFSLLPKLKEELNQMASRLLDLCDGNEDAKEVTIQLGLHAFPLTKVNPNKE